MKQKHHLKHNKDQVDTSSEHDTTRHGMKEHSSNTDAPMNTINGILNTTSQEQHLFTELLNNNIPGIIVDNVYEGTHNCLERR